MTKYTQEKQHGGITILKGKIQKNLSSEKKHNIGNEN